MGQQLTKQKHHQLFDEHHDWLKRICSSLAYKHGQDPDEYLQIGYLGFRQAAERYNGDADYFRMYAFTRIRGAIIDNYRAGKQFSAYKSDQHDRNLVEEYEDHRHVDDQIEIEFKRLISCLDNDKRNVLLMKYVWGCRWTEISITLGISESAVMKRHDAAIEILRGIHAKGHKFRMY